MIKVLIIGKKSFIGSNLYKYLKSKIFVKLISYSDFNNKNDNFFKKYTHIINCSINPKYLKYKYKENLDNDYQITKKIKKYQIKYIFFSSRKVYKPKYNIRENGKLLPKSAYSKNKLITEKKLLLILKKKLLIFRVSNIIGIPVKNNKNKVHNTFIDEFFNSAKKGIIYENYKNFKDFISMKTFSEIVYLSIKKNIFGLYNLSMGKKVYLNKLVKWLNSYNKKSFNVIKSKKMINNTDNFTLNNDKLTKIISFKNSINDLEKYCRKISKIYFKKKI